MNITHRIPTPAAIQFASTVAAGRALRHGAQAVWNFFEAYGRARATTELRRTAELLESSHPEAAARLREAVRSNHA